MGGPGAMGVGISFSVLAFGARENRFLAFGFGAQFVPGS